LQNVSPSADITVSSQPELDLLLGPLYDEFFNTDPTTSTTNFNAEENNDNQAEDTQVQQAEFINPFCTPPMQTRRQLATNPEMCMVALTVSTVEPKTIKEAMADSAMDRGNSGKRFISLTDFQVWELVDNTLWQEYMLVWILIDMLHTSLLLNLSDGRGEKWNFLMVQLREEVFVHNSLGLLIPNFPEKVYLLRKALYGLKQAPRAWYDELSNFLMSKGFTKGTNDPTLFTIKYGEDILLV
ncbi:retrovirus-related pol polyprotein from transposon TNT 1-94, partial [Tanacetum coccineum]